MAGDVGVADRAARRLRRRQARDHGRRDRPARCGAGWRSATLVRVTGPRRRDARARRSACARACASRAARSSRAASASTCRACMPAGCARHLAQGHRRPTPRRAATSTLDLGGLFGDEGGGEDGEPRPARRTSRSSPSGSPTCIATTASAPASCRRAPVTRSSSRRVRAARAALAAGSSATRASGSPAARATASSCAESVYAEPVLDLDRRARRSVRGSGRLERRDLRRRRAPSACGQLAALVHLGDDVAAADQLAADEQLRDRRPARTAPTAPGGCAGRAARRSPRTARRAPGAPRPCAPRSRTAAARACPS